MSDARPDHSLSEIVGGLASDVQDLVRGEIALARAELNDRLSNVISAGTWIMAGALLSFAGLVVTLIGIAAVLAVFMPEWVALLLVGVVVIVIGAVLARSGAGMLSARALTPDRTAQNLQKDAHVVKEHI